jgi:hypothetical protein
VESAADEEINKVAFGIFLLMISTTAWITLLGYPQLPPARRWSHQPYQWN